MSRVSFSSAMCSSVPGSQEAAASESVSLQAPHRGFTTTAGPVAAQSGGGVNMVRAGRASCSGQEVPVPWKPTPPSARGRRPAGCRGRQPQRSAAAAAPNPPWPPAAPRRRRRLPPSPRPADEPAPEEAAHLRNQLGSILGLCHHGHGSIRPFDRAHTPAIGKTALPTTNSRKYSRPGPGNLNK